VRGAFCLTKNVDEADEQAMNGYWMGIGRVLYGCWMGIGRVLLSEN